MTGLQCLARAVASTVLAMTRGELEELTITVAA